jgi:pimeloyl-ACP methyl ester carboxylesterase
MTGSGRVIGRFIPEDAALRPSATAGRRFESPRRIRRARAPGGGSGRSVQGGKRAMIRRGRAGFKKALAFAFGIAFTTHLSGAAPVMEEVTLGGVPQKILVLSDHPDAPVLLYLHGGPGEPIIAVSHRFTGGLAKAFTVVAWDQRGCGFSYSPSIDSSALSVTRIRADALELTRMLMKRFGQERIFLVGHSFGSVVGLPLAARHPECFYAYIGVGQVLDWNRSKGISLRWLRDELIRRNDAGGLKRIEGAEVPPMDLIRKCGGVTRQPLDYRAIERGSPFWREDYPDLKSRGRDFSQRHVTANGDNEPEPGTFLDLAIPVFFLEGRHDHVAASAPELVIEYCAKASAPKKRIIWFENSGHLPNLEEPDRFQEVLAGIRDEILGRP